MSYGSQETSLPLLCTKLHIWASSFLAGLRTYLKGELMSSYEPTQVTDIICTFPPQIDKPLVLSSTRGRQTSQDSTGNPTMLITNYLLKLLPHTDQFNPISRFTILPALAVHLG